MTKKIVKGIASIPVLLALAVALSSLSVLLPKLQVANDSKVLGSVVVGNEYRSTRVHAVSTTPQTLKTGTGSLGQITITGDNTGLITLYDATTSDATKRALATTSLTVLADFPASTPEGTYVFDNIFNDGLLLVTSGTPATSTVMWR